MARTVSTDESGKNVAAAARKVNKIGKPGTVISGSTFTPGKSELYSNRGKK